MTSAQEQKLPRTGTEREKLRSKGQFWTPSWVAESMVAYVVGGGSAHVFDPAVGAGAFFRAAKVVGAETNRRFELFGCEVDAGALVQARESGLTEDDLVGVRLADFVLCPPEREFAAIAANPPYMRHHRLSSEVKASLRRLSITLTGHTLDGRAGLHVYFLLRALQLLAPSGRLAFIVPADTCEGVFAPVLWRWVTARYRLEAVATFDAAATPFPGVDTNAIILFISNNPPEENFAWSRCRVAESSDLKRWCASDFAEVGASLDVRRRTIVEGIETGFSRTPPRASCSAEAHTLGDFARVMRGVATGANEFFFLTQQRANELGIPSDLLLPAIGRTRDVEGDRLDRNALARLDAAGRPTLLFSPDGRAPEEFTHDVRAYLSDGEALGLHHRTLIATRRPWYKMEVRRPPAFLFAYLGRRNARFIRNLASAVPLTGFLCVYPLNEDAGFCDELGRVLCDRETIANLVRVGKSYGGGAIKVEPRALERLPLPSRLVAGSERLKQHLVESACQADEMQLRFAGV